MLFIFRTKFKAKVVAPLMILAMLITTLTPSVAFAQNSKVDYSKTDITTESLEVKKDGTYLFDTQKAMSMGMSEGNAIKAKESFDSLTLYVKKNSDNWYIKNNSDLPQVEPASKGSVMIKATIDYMKAHKTKIDNAINTAIDKIPFVKEKIKENWKEAVTVGALIKALSHYIGVTETVEEAISGAITDISPIPGYAADIIAKTITLFLPL